MPIITNKKIIIFTAIVISFLFINFGYFFSAQAANLKDAFTSESGSTELKPLDEIADKAGYKTDKINEDISSLIGPIINTALSLVGVIFLVLMIYGGFLWMTAHGNEEQVTKAKSLITAALIGLVIILSAYAISVFVISKLGQGTLSETTQAE